MFIIEIKPNWHLVSQYSLLKSENAGPVPTFEAIPLSRVSFTRQAWIDIHVSKENRNKEA